MPRRDFAYKRAQSYLNRVHDIQGSHLLHLHLTRTSQDKDKGSLIRVHNISSNGSYRLEEFLKELPTVIRRAETNLATLLGNGVSLARLLKLRELQTSFVYSTVLAKKNKVGCFPTNTISQAGAGNNHIPLLQLHHAPFVHAGLISQLL